MLKDSIEIKFKLLRSDIIIWSSVIIAAAVLNIIYKRTPYYFNEDRIIQNIQVVILLLSSVIAFINSFRKDRRPFEKLYLILALVTFFLCLEEIDYGQQWLDFKSPAVFVKYAFQEEFSIHHLLLGMVDIPAHLILITVSIIALAKWKSYHEIRLLNKLPRLSRLKYVLLLGCALYYMLTNIILLAVPIVTHGITHAGIKDSYGLIAHEHYHELVETIEYLVILILVTFKPKKL